MKKRRIIEELENNLIDVRESDQKEISSLFAEARTKLYRINQGEKDKIDIVKNEASKKKKDVVVELAQKLEYKIEQTDTICQIIVDQLEGVVDDRFVRQCLPEKYKQKYRVNNAKKQKKNSQEESKLAVLTPLNQDQNKETIIVDIDSKTFQKNEDESSTNTKETSTRKNDISGNIKSELENQQQQQELKRQID